MKKYILRYAALLSGAFLLMQSSTSCLDDLDRFRSMTLLLRKCILLSRDINLSLPRSMELMAM